MKYATVLLLLVPATLSTSAVKAQQPSPSASVAGSSMGYSAVGVVKQADASAGKVTIAHDAIAGLNWPAMTMSFSVKDKSLFDKLTVDRKVEFTVAKQGAAYVITSVK